MNNLKSLIHKFFLDHKTIFATMVERMLAFPCQRLIGKKFAFIADYAIYYNNWARLLVLGIAPFILLGPIPKTFLIQMVVVKITAWFVCAIYIGELGNVYANTNELHHDPKSWIKSHHTHNTYCHLYCIKKVLVYWSRSTWTQKSTTKCRSESKDFFYLNIEHLFEQSSPFFKCFIQCPVDILPIVLLTINSPMLTGPYTKMTRKIISVQRRWRKRFALVRSLTFNVNFESYRKA